MTTEAVREVIAAKIQEEQQADHKNIWTFVGDDGDRQNAFVSYAADHGLNLGDEDAPIPDLSRDASKTYNLVLTTTHAGRRVCRAAAISRAQTISAVVSVAQAWLQIKEDAADAITIKHVGVPDEPIYTRDSEDVLSEVKSEDNTFWFEVTVANSMEIVVLEPNRLLLNALPDDDF